MTMPSLASAANPALRRDEPAASRSRLETGLALVYLLVGAALIGGTGWGMMLGMANPVPGVVGP